MQKEEIAEFLIQKGYLLTALEFYQELLEDDGTDLESLKDYFIKQQPIFESESPRIRGIYIMTSSSSSSSSSSSLHFTFFFFIVSLFAYILLRHHYTSLHHYCIHLLHMTPHYIITPTLK